MRTRILVLSDISWRSIQEKDLEKRIRALNPSLVLLAGDLVNDGGRWDQITRLVKFLDHQRIRTLLVQGNWDERPAYEELVHLTQSLRYVEEISGRIVAHKGIRILGIPFSATYNKAEAKSLSQTYPMPVDIVLTHAFFENRIWLLDLDTKFLITGHFDSQLCQIRGTVFISLYSFPGDYVVIDYGPIRQIITYYGGVGRHRILSRQAKARVKHGRLIWITAPLNEPGSADWRGVPGRPLTRFTDSYGELTEELIAARAKLLQDPSCRQVIVERLVSRGIPKLHIKNYLGASKERRTA